MRRGDSTVVIGASAAGLAVARCLQERGLGALVLEQKPQVGEAWRRHYDRLHLHTPRDGSALPYRAMPSSFPTYPSRLQVIDYLEHYAAGLKTPPLFNQAVKAVRQEHGVWVTVTDDRVFASNNVVIATGCARKPVVPSWPGQERYTGRLIHSADYRNGYGFANHRVLVVGFGNSAAEIAVDLAENGAHPTLSVRGAVNVIPRDVLGIPVQSLGLMQRLFPPRVADMINAPVVRLAIGDITRHGLRKLPYGPATQVRERGQIPVIDAGTMKLIRKGVIAVRPGIAAFTDTGVVFVDGVREAFDTMILGTGYRPAVDEFLKGADAAVDSHGMPTVSGGATALPGLYFCGFKVTLGGTLKQIGIEARAIASLIDAETATLSTA
jgi:indole-3-pyruvate monooxygenase